MALTRSRYCSGLFLLILASQLMVTLGTSTYWWNLAVADCGRRGSVCPTCAQFLNNTLSESQANMCYEDSSPIEAIAKGSRDAIVECQVQNKDNKWNCSTFFSQDLFGKFVVAASTRETAIIQAYLAAGAVKGIAADCHSQKIRECTCDLDGDAESQDADGNLIYRDCSENYQYALNYVLNFIFPELKVIIRTERYVATFSIERDRNGGISTSLERTALTQVSTDPPTQEPETTEYTQVLNDVHNTVVGLRAVNKTSQECLCHGLSGGCSIQTCYTKIPELSEIGKDLSLKYSGAIKVVKEQNSTILKNVYSGRKDPTADDLVYESESPNFCIRDLPNGVIGTQDRLCIPNGDGSDSCQSLCCDNGFYTLQYTIPDEVCEFVWCCYIDCTQRGQKEITEHRCNGPRNL